MNPMDLANLMVSGIHDEKAAGADSIFLKQNQSTLCWIGMGNLSRLVPTCEACMGGLQEIRPAQSPLSPRGQLD